MRPSRHCQRLASHRGVTWCAAVATLLTAATTSAAPQANAGLTAGVGGRGESAFWDDTVFVGGLRGDVMFGREGPHDFGIGPYAAIETAAFGDFRPGVGVTTLLPVHDAFPIVLSAGPILVLDGDVRVGGSGRLFVGSRSFNYYGPYVLSGGIVLGLDQTFGDRAETVALVAAQIDLALVALPFMLAYQAAFGGEGTED